MGMPQILIEFKNRAVSAIQRSQKGIVALVLVNAGDFDTKVYRSIDEVNKEDWTTENYDYISKTFMGTPNRIVVERIALADDIMLALTRLNTKKWNYLAIPSATVTTDISTWIKSMRLNNKKTFKAVLANSSADNEGVINFTAEDIVVGDKTYTTSEYTTRIAGVLAGLPFTRSATYFVLPEVDSVKEVENPDAAIQNGELILVNDGEKVKIGRAVNSFISPTVEKSKIFSKIKIVEGMDLMLDDIRDTFNNSYVGKVINNYDNKILFLSSVNAYFKQLAIDSILDINYDNKAEINLKAQKLYLQSIGIDIDELEEQEIKEHNTESTVFAAGKVKFVDAMEDLAFNIEI